MGISGSCHCVFYDLQYISPCNRNYSISFTIYYLLKKIRVLNWGKNLKKKTKNKKDFIFKRNNLGNSYLIHSLIKPIQFDINRYEFSKNSGFTTIFRKLLIILKSALNDNCEQTRILLIDTIKVLSLYYSFDKILYLIDVTSCQNNHSFRQHLLKLLLPKYKLKNFSSLFPFIRSLACKKNNQSFTALPLLIINLFLKNKLELVHKEIREIILILKKFIKTNEFLFLKLSFFILEKISPPQIANLNPDIHELCYIFYTYFKKRVKNLRGYFLKMSEFLIQQFKLKYNPDLCRDIVVSLRKILPFHNIEKILAFIAKTDEKELIDKKIILVFFFRNYSRIQIDFQKKKPIKKENPNKKLVRNLIYKMKKKEIENFIKKGFLDKFFKKEINIIIILNFLLRKSVISIQEYSKEVIQDSFRQAFSIINRFSLGNLNQKTIVKKAFQFLLLLIIKLNTKSKPFLSQIAGLLKWSFNNNNPCVRKNGACFFSKSIPSFYFFGEKTLIGHLGVILINKLDEPYPRTLKYFLLCLEQIIKVFPGKFCIPPIEIIFSNVIHLCKNRISCVTSNLIFLFSTIIDKKWHYIPRKDLILACFNLIKIQKNLNLNDRKKSINVICKISKILGPEEIINFLIGSLDKIHQLYRIPIIITLTTIAFDHNLHLVLPGFFQKNLKLNISCASYVFKSLIYILEYLDHENLSNYSNSIGIIIQKEMVCEKNLVNPFLFLLMGKFTQKFKFHGFETRLIWLFKYVCVIMLISTKSMLKYIFYALEKLTTALNPLVWCGYLFQGLIHQKKKIRILYWKFKKLVKFQKTLMFYFLKFSIGSKRNLFRSTNFFL